MAAFDQERASTTLAATLGFYSAAIAALTFVVYTVCFVGIALTSPLFMWTSLEDYLAYAEAHGGPFQPAAQTAMLVFGISLVVALNSIHACTRAERRVLTRIGISFGSLFALAVAIHYFAQLSAVRMGIAEGQTAGLEHFVQANPYSILSAINVLGWTVLLGLASAFVAPVFTTGRLEQLIRAAFLSNASFCLSGSVAYALEITWLVFVTTTLGMGAAVLVATTALAVWFGRIAHPDRDARRRRRQARRLD